MRLLIFSFLVQLLLIVCITEARPSPHGNHGPGIIDAVGKGIGKLAGKTKDKWQSLWKDRNNVPDNSEEMAGPIFKKATIDPSCNAYEGQIQDAFSQALSIAENARATSFWILDMFQKSDNDRITQKRLSLSLKYLFGNDVTINLNSNGKRNLLKDLSGMYHIFLLASFLLGLDN